MIKLKNIINEEKIKGLYKAKVGDYISIGIEGTR